VKNERSGIEAAIQQMLDETKQAIAAGKCVDCGNAFTEENVHTADGWRETQISGLCEDCFDLATEEPDDEWDDEAPAF